MNGSFYPSERYEYQNSIRLCGFPIWETKETREVASKKSLSKISKSRSLKNLRNMSVKGKNFQLKSQKNSTMNTETNERQRIFSAIGSNESKNNQFKDVRNINFYYPLNHS